MLIAMIMFVLLSLFLFLSLPLTLCVCAHHVLLCVCTQCVLKFAEKGVGSSPSGSSRELP